MVTNKKQIGVWAVFLLIWPVSLFYLFHLSDPGIIQKYSFDIISFLLLMGIVALFPIIVNGTPIFFIQGISLAVFLYFGLFVEIVLTQISVLFLMIKIRIPKSEAFRIPLNMTMFLLVSLLSASVYKLLGGVNGAISFNEVSNIIPVVGYAVTMFVANQLILNVVKQYLTGGKVKLFNISLLWEFLTTLIVIPVGFILYVLYVQIGAVAIYYIGLPLVAISVILTLFYSSRQINYALQKTSDIGHELTGRLDVKEVLDIFIKRVSDTLEVDYAYTYDVVKQRYLNLIRYVDVVNKTDVPDIQLQPFEGISGEVFGNEKGVHFQSRKQWQNKEDKTLPESVESLMSIPIKRNNLTVGVITIASKRKRAYQKYHYMILDILSNYLAVAIENARHYQVTKNKSERCALTKLYNYRYFENYLTEYCKDLEAKGAHEHISVVLLDLDHFKSVNDRYGHESGNEVLCYLAERLTAIINSDQGIVARYGGEEFVILLPGITREHSLHIAENIRRKIANEPFVLNKHIMDKDKEIEINVTASIGVATFPNDCEDPLELIRHADRAMYMGAKRKGRNKVASYEKLTEAAE